MSARIAVPRKLVVPGLAGPGPLESRVVACVVAPKPANDPDYGYTVVVADRVRLLGIRIHFMPAAPDITRDCTYYLKTGFKRPDSAAEVLAWDDIITVGYKETDKGMWRAFYGLGSVSWDMNVLYTGGGRRFACYVRLGGLAIVHELFVSFQISEG